MTDTPVPSELDWVKARAECSLYRVFKELLEGVKKDVEKRNYYRQQGQPSKWTVGAITSNGFTVFREETTFKPSGETIDFVLSEHGIKVSNENETKFTATLSLNNQGRCVLKVGNAELEQWQVRRMALESLFFGAV